MSDDYSGIIALLQEFRRKSLATSRFYLGIDRETFKQDDWPRSAEVDLIESLIAKKAQEITGQPEISESLWRRCNAFAHSVAAPWLGKEKQPDESWADAQRDYEYGESKFHEASGLWADHTLDYLKYLQASDAGSSKSVPTITILFLAANPVDTTRLRLQEELREVREELERAKLRDRFTLQSRGAVRPKDFVRAMLDLVPAFVHFSGHGASSGSICVENDHGDTVELEPEAVADLFQASGTHVECVLLNACFSERQARAIAAHVPHVIGMTHAISDRAAIAFATGFYRAIGAGRKVPEAFQFGLVELKMYSIPEHSTPVLVKAT